MGDEIDVTCLGGICKITLNAPKRLNALSRHMSAVVGDTLAYVRNRQDVRAVLVRSASDKAFCAGGDIRTIYNAAAGNIADAMRLLATEYRMNWRIHGFEKPYISLLDGIVMGGGLGVSLHGSHRVLAENALCAMPECGIGFAPDVGSVDFLSRLKGHMGVYLGLTGARITAPDALKLGIGTHFVARQDFDAIEDALIKADLSGDAYEAVDSVLSRFHTHPKAQTPICDASEAIGASFDAPGVEEIIETLSTSDTPWARATLKALAMQAPLSLKVAFRALSEAPLAGFDAMMRQDFRLALRFVEDGTIFEGIRAQIIDKDRNPKWPLASLEAVSKAHVDAFFAPSCASQTLSVDWENPTQTYPEAFA